MPEYFVVANSFAAPFFSDLSQEYIKGKTPTEAITRFRKGYRHPMGLFAAMLYANADDFHKEKEPLLVWLSKAAKEQEKGRNDDPC